MATGPKHQSMSLESKTSGQSISPPSYPPSPFHTEKAGTRFLFPIAFNTTLAK